MSDKSEVYGDARVYGKARIYGDADVYGKARVYENAHIYGGEAHAYGNARVYGDARVYGKARVYSNAHVYGNAHVRDGAEVSGNAKVHEQAKIYGNARVSGTAVVRGSAQIFGEMTIWSEVYDGKQEYRRAGRTLYRNLFLTYSSLFSECNRQNELGWDDDFIRRNVRYLLSKDVNDRNLAAALVLGCAQLGFLGDIRRILTPSGWEVFFSFALNVVGAARLGSFVTVLLQIAQSLEIFSTAVDVGRLSEKAKGALEMMKAFEKCDTSCEV